MTRADGAAALIASAKTESRTVALAFDPCDAVIIGKCPFRTTFAGGELCVTIAAWTLNGRNPEALFVRASLCGFHGPFNRVGWGDGLDLLEVSRDSHWPRTAMHSSGVMRNEFFDSLRGIVGAEIRKIASSLTEAV